NKNLPGDILACADASEFLTAVMAALETDRASSADATFASDDPATVTSARATGGERTARMRQGWGSDFDFDSIGARVTRFVEQGAGPNVVIAGDSSQVTYDGTVPAASASTPAQLRDMPGCATLGHGAPAALGATAPDVARPVALVPGDGAATSSVQELMTAPELGLGIPFGIVDNGGYAEIE